MSYATPAAARCQGIAPVANQKTPVTSRAHLVNVLPLGRLILLSNTGQNLVMSRRFQVECHRGFESNLGRIRCTFLTQTGQPLAKTRYTVLCLSAKGVYLLHKHQTESTSRETHLSIPSTRRNASNLEALRRYI